MLFYTPVTKYQDKEHNFTTLIAEININKPIQLQMIMYMPNKGESGSESDEQL